MRTWCDVSLDNLKYNIEQIKGKLSDNVKLCGIVKANAYGHGVEEIVLNLVQQGVDYLAVAFIDEAIEIRLCGFDEPILILGNTPKDTASSVVEYNITASVYNKETAQAISDEAVRQNKIAKIHIKIDTGMSRIGFLPTEESIAEIMEVSKLPNIETEGIFTHFACSDSDDESETLKQYDKFMWVVSRLENQGLYIPVKHCCNSAAIVKYPNMHLDMVRAGIILYGMYPSDIDYDIDLKPLMNFKTSVINVKTIEAGQSISYGATFTAKDTMKIATIAVGYADGYSRLLSNCGRVLVNGQFANIVGRICMDQCMIDVTNVHNIGIGDEVILFGADENETLPIEELAVKLGTINYELPCIINNRVPRCYTKDNKRIKIHNNLSVAKSL